MSHRLYLTDLERAELLALVDEDLKHFQNMEGVKGQIGQMRYPTGYSHDEAQQHYRVLNQARIKLTPPARTSGAHGA
jgi:hypothetical protein